LDISYEMFRSLPAKESNLTTTTVPDSPVVANPTRELVDFVERQVFNEKLHVADDRRSEVRDLMVVMVLAQPVDADYQPIDAPFHLVTRNLSPKGAGLIHFEPILHDRLALQMCIANTIVNLVARIVWCKPLGPFYACGVEFIARLDAFPAGHEFTKPRRTSSESL